MIPLVFALVGGALSFKAGQAVSDVDYPGTTVPPDVREEVIQGHLRLYGACCPRCERKVAIWELQVDHKIPIAEGGRNSWYNLQVLCRECNQRKGTNYTFWEGFTGRKR